jgi:hypothetical protein
MAEMVPLIEAAQRLGVSVDAIRRRIRRGTITAEKREDRWFVEVPDGEAAYDSAQASAYDAPRPPPPVPDAMIQAMIVMQRQMDILTSELEVKNQQLADAAIERAELRRLLGNSQMMLTAGRSEAPGPPQGTMDEESGPRPARTPQDRPQPYQRAAWRWPWQRKD